MIYTAKAVFGGVPSVGGVEELRNYVVYLVDELTYLLNNLDEENMTDGLIEKIERNSE